MVKEQNDDQRPTHHDDQLGLGDPPVIPDLAALYETHRHSMYRVAASVLREAGIADQAEDVVHDAITSILASPPENRVENWEAFLVTATKRRALDRIDAAFVRHAGPGLAEQHDRPDRDVYVEDDVAERIDSKRDGAKVWDALSVLDQRHRRVATGISEGMSRDELAAELGVTPPRISQIYRKALEQLREAVAREEENT